MVATAAAAATSFATPAAISSFQAHLQRSKKVLALCGAGLSAASGLPTFRGAGGMWKSYQATDLATHEAFEEDPGLVWQFYAYRRHMALQARPNAGHVALAELARRMEGFVCLTQNVDGLSTAANHPADKLHLLHGSLMDLKCDNYPVACDYVERDNRQDPLCPALDVSSLDPNASDTTGAEATKSLYSAMGLNNPRAPAASDADSTIPIAALPHCPKCNLLLRPGVVWFGEALPKVTLKAVDDWIEACDTIDLMLVIGTTAEVYPAAGYIEEARRKGALVAVINYDSSHLGASGNLTDDDWMFEGNAAAILPVLLRDVLQN